ncbi:MAG: hypothetical protein WCL51_17165 [Bacteroidota bacterium]
MGKGTTHQGRTIRVFHQTFIVTTNYIVALSPGTPSATNGVRLGIPTQVMADCAGFRSRWDAGMLLYGNKKDTRTTLVKDGLNLIIKEFVAYDKKHHLTDGVAANPIATLEDYVAFNITQGTSLAKTTKTRSSDPGSKRVVITMKEMGHLFHKMEVSSPDIKGRGLEDGVSHVLFYKIIIAADAVVPPFKNFEYVGHVKNGYIMITHTDDLLGQKAWYAACIENSRGEKGVPSEPVGFIII